MKLSEQVKLLERENERLRNMIDNLTEQLQDLCRAYLKVRPKEEIHSEHESTAGSPGTENEPACGAHSPGDDPCGD